MMGYCLLHFATGNLAHHIQHEIGHSLFFHFICVHYNNAFLQYIGFDDAFLLGIFDRALHGQPLVVIVGPSQPPLVIDPVIQVLHLLI